MKAAKLETSDRLQRVKAMLMQGGEYSTMDIVNHARVCAVNSIISELRANGVRIHTRIESKKTAHGHQRTWYYRMEDRHD